jgi:hypothetical protein
MAERATVYNSFIERSHDDEDMPWQPLENGEERKEKKWLRGMDSNHDSQLQRLVSCRLDDPGIV